MQFVLETLTQSSITAEDLNTSSSSDCSGIDSDDEMLLTRMKRVKIENYFESTVTEYSDKDFKRHFRLSRESVEKLCTLIEVQKHHVGGWPEISKTKMVHMMLWYLANTNTFREVADRFNVTESACHRTIQMCVKALKKTHKRFIKCHLPNEFPNVAKWFRDKKGIPFIIGAIDGSHVAIDRPQQNQEDYVNRKGFHSILMQAIVDHRKLFTDIYVGEPGSLHDARLLRKSPIFNKIEREDNLFPYCIIGDSAYPSSLNWLVTPYKDNGHLSNDQKQFNQRISGTRVIVEHSFGLLKGRFRRLNGFHNKNISFIIDCVVSATILHNLCLLWDDCGDEFVDNEVLPNEEVDDGKGYDCIPGRTRRDEIFNMLY